MMDPYELETTREGQIALLPRVYTVRLSCGKCLVKAAHL